MMGCRNWSNRCQLAMNRGVSILVESPAKSWLKIKGVGCDVKSVVCRLQEMDKLENVSFGEIVRTGLRQELINELRYATEHRAEGSVHEADDRSA